MADLAVSPINLWACPSTFWSIPSNGSSGDPTARRKLGIGTHLNGVFVIFRGDRLIGVAAFVPTAIRCLGGRNVENDVDLFENLPIHRLKAAEQNARLHSKKQFRQIADSVKRFGFRVLID